MVGQIEQGIRVDKLIAQTYSKLVEKYSTGQVTFEKPVRTPIGYTSGVDTIDYMRYDRVVMLNINGKTWFVGLGEPAVHRISHDKYTNDIFATNFKGEWKPGDYIEDQIRFKFSKYFPQGDVIEDENLNEAEGLESKQVPADYKADEFIAYIEKDDLSPDTPNIEYGLRAVIESSLYFSSSLVFGKAFNKLDTQVNGRFGDKMQGIVEHVKKEYGIWLDGYGVYFIGAREASPTYKPEAVDYLVEQIEQIFSE